MFDIEVNKFAINFTFEYVIYIYFIFECLYINIKNVDTNNNHICMPYLMG